MQLPICVYLIIFNIGHLYNKCHHVGSVVEVMQARKQLAQTMRSYHAEFAGAHLIVALYGVYGCTIMRRELAERVKRLTYAIRVCKARANGADNCGNASVVVAHIQVMREFPF